MKSKILIISMALFLLLPLGSAFALEVDYTSTYTVGDLLALGGRYDDAKTQTKMTLISIDWVGKEHNPFTAGNITYEISGNDKVYFTPVYGAYTNAWLWVRTDSGVLYDYKDTKVIIHYKGDFKNSISKVTVGNRLGNGTNYDKEYSGDTLSDFFLERSALEVSLEKVPITKMMKEALGGGLLSVALIIFAILLGVGLLPRLKSLFLR